MVVNNVIVYCYKIDAEFNSKHRNSLQWRLILLVLLGSDLDDTFDEVVGLAQADISEWLLACEFYLLLIFLIIFLLIFALSDLIYGSLPDHPQLV